MFAARTCYAAVTWVGGTRAFGVRHHGQALLAATDGGHRGNRTDFAGVLGVRTLIAVGTARTWWAQVTDAGVEKT